MRPQKRTVQQGDTEPACGAGNDKNKRKESARAF